MTRLLAPLFSASLLAAAPPAIAASTPLTFYVATNGNDVWSGHLAVSNTERTDGPLASLAGARDRIRGERTAGQTVQVLVRGGAYSLTAPFVLEPPDSGSREAPVVYAAYQKEKPVFSGGRTVTDFHQAGDLWETTIPEVRAGHWYFRQLFVNGERRQRARAPNTGYYRIAKLIPGPPVPNAKPVARDKFVFAPGDLQPWERLNDVELVLMHSWENSIHPLKSVDTVSNIVEFAAPLKEWWGLGYWEDRQRYFVENARELLDTPGEWYLNRETGVLTYWPMAGERLGETRVVAPFLTEFVRFTGNAEKGEFVRYIALRGLSFHHADWVLDAKGNSSTQAAVEVPATITADGALDCVVENCEVAHIGTYGIWFRRGCKDCRLQHNRLFDLGAGGIRVGEAQSARQDVSESSRTLVDNNHIFNGGRIYPGCVGIWVAQSSGNRISHNDLHDLFYTGISIGWNWGLEPNRTSNNVIEFNHVHNLGQGVLSDAGLIYCLGVSPGSVIRNNVFHDMWPYSTPAFGWGIYLDAQCGEYLVESNLVYNTRSGGLMFNNGGHEHIIRNNIFASSTSHGLWPYFEKRPNTFQHNIVYLTQGELLIPYGERSLNERLAAKESLGLWDDNLYWHTAGPDALRFFRRTFSEWQALGLDRHSRIADPQFLDAATHDFRLKPGSPAFDLGFRQFNISKVGLYGDAAWVKEADHAHCARIALPAPYPHSRALQSIVWDWKTHVTAALGSDLWPVAWGLDDLLYSAWGDGGGFGGSDSDGRVALGFARIEGMPEDWRGVNVNGGKSPEHPASFSKKGKTTGIASVDGVLYATVNLENGAWPDVDHVLAWSTNKGATWARADWLFPKGSGNFQPAKFVTFGRDYTGLPEPLAGYVYLCGPRQSADPGSGNRLYLARAPRNRLREQAVYEYFEQADARGTGVWVAGSAQAQPVFVDPNGVTPGAIVYDPGIKRFLLTCFHVGPGQLGVFDAPSLWGPWTTVAYYEDWGQMGTEGEGLTCGFPQKWMSADGLTLWSIFSVYGDGAKKGVIAHDRFNLVKARLVPLAQQSVAPR